MRRSNGVGVENGCFAWPDEYQIEIRYAFIERQAISIQAIRIKEIGLNKGFFLGFVFALAVRHYGALIGRFP